MDEILVTGINGYIGSHIGRAFLRDGKRVIGLDLGSDNIDDMMADPNFEFLRADITDRGSIPDEVKKSDALVHCAALVHKRSSDLSRDNYFRINSAGTVNILEAVDPARVKQVVLLSTVSVYGHLAEEMIPDENGPIDPDDYYGESKAAAEDHVRSYSRGHGIAHTILRLAPVYGRSFLLNVRKRVYLPGGLSFYRIGRGTQRLSLCSVNNVVGVVVAGMGKTFLLNETFNVSDSGDYSINDMILFFKDLYSQGKKPVVPIPRAFPLLLFRLLSLALPERAGYYAYQFNKVAKDARYSVEKLRATGIPLIWNLRNTFEH